jgi:hypothetical protein
MVITQGRIPILENDTMRKNIIHTQPYIVLLIACGLLAVIAWIRWDNLIDIQLYDTYFVATVQFLAGVCGGIMLVTSVFYWFSRERPGLPQLTAAHVLGSIGLSIYMVASMGGPPQRNPGQWTVLSPPQYQEWKDKSDMLAVLLLVFLTFQLLFIANMVYKLITREKSA